MINMDDFYNQALDNRKCSICKNKYYYDLDISKIQYKCELCNYKMTIKKNEFAILNKEDYFLVFDYEDNRVAIYSNYINNNDVIFLLDMSCDEWLENFKTFNFNNVIKIFFKYIDNEIFV